MYVLGHPPARPCPGIPGSPPRHRALARAAIHARFQPAMLQNSVRNCHMHPAPIWSSGSDRSTKNCVLQRPTSSELPISRSLKQMTVWLKALGHSTNFRGLFVASSNERARAIVQVHYIPAVANEAGPDPRYNAEAECGDALAELSAAYDRRR